MARAAGLRLIDRWSDWNREPVTAERSAVISLWQKPEYDSSSIRSALVASERGKRQTLPVRLHIIGLPSAGKTTLGEDLSTLLMIPHHDLDGVAFVDERWTMRAAGEREAMIADILEESSYVTEGGFIGWTDPVFAAAQHILWLDPPLRTLILRHVRRHGRHPWRLVDHLRFQVLMYVPARGRDPRSSIGT